MTASKPIYFLEKKGEGRKEKRERRKEIPVPASNLFGTPIYN